MKKRFQISLLLITVIIIGQIIGTSAFAKTAFQQITAYYRDIGIVVNGETRIPKDVNGNVVEPFIYYGTTYLPVRAISEALGCTVEWDGDTYTAYIKNMPNVDSGCVETDCNNACHEPCPELDCDNQYEDTGCGVTPNYNIPQNGASCIKPNYNQIMPFNYYTFSTCPNRR